MDKEQTWSDWIKERDDPGTAHTKPEALDDITVLDLSYKSFAGCYCSSMLSEFGAEEKASTTLPRAETSFILPWTSKSRRGEKYLKAWRVRLMYS
jgi:hypothetical protein